LGGRQDEFAGRLQENQLKLQRIVAAKNFKKSSGAPRSTELWMPICCISFSNPKKKQSDAKGVNVNKPALYIHPARC